MSQDGNLADCRITGDCVQQLLQGIARVERALPIVAVGEHAAPRGPGEQDRDHWRIGIVNDLRETEDRIFEAVVEAVDEDEDLPARNTPHRALKP